MLKDDNKLMERLGDDLELSRDRKVEFLDEQISAMKTILWRERVNLMAFAAIEYDDDDEKFAATQRIKETKNNIEKTAKMLQANINIRNEVVA